MNSLKQAEKPWKQALYIYVNQYNQNRVDYSSGLKEQIVADLNFLVERERQFRCSRGMRRRLRRLRARLVPASCAF